MRNVGGTGPRGLSKLVMHAGRATARICLLVGAIGTLALLSSAQAASAAVEITSISPTSGCPGTVVTITGRHLEPYGFHYPGKSKLSWVDGAVGAESVEQVTVESETKATAVVP
ncbi:MAG TPA: IPT/TIG domain-containing protein, partial [Steroidobacteraceae bacterium]|nr:IPT/TIG domain-containing protein [Steroidobacteraceae bacterium]